ncbi:hypothetical protein MLD38_008323 [Melastoma candidum]|uniref:Uncharacterized protein n=1 Tax=Melastoma candidum TaxID=119954 RepID=A0ACB9RTK6_9MYRT|nr:hypothetical protein MLD38_008323 [Melastoma candidum]
MGAVSVNRNGDEDAGALVAQGNHVHYDQQVIINGVFSNGHCRGSSEEDNSRPNGIVEHGNSGLGTQVRGCNGYQPQPQQGPVIRWERFLSVKSVKVLLVENDDSTRQVLTALLRNCGYEVVAVANGLQAWKALDDLSDHVDLVLTEVVMPLLSGIGLLSKIMSHKTFSNIPVIMMSSHDSMGIVFKCLSKGAVDFLVKPIRKNELKNLWQHVWRRCHSSSGSGSESGTQTKRSTKLRSCDDSVTNSSGSSDEHDIGSNAMSIQNGSDDGSGTQSSWTQKIRAVGSPKPVSAGNEWGDAPDSTCAQVIYTGPDILGKMEKEDPGKDSLVHANGEVELKLSDQGQTEANLDFLVGKSGDVEPNKNIGNSSCIHPESRELEPVNGLSGVYHVKNKDNRDSGELPSLELTLKRLEGADESGNTVCDNHKTLRHSDLSAFSKFNTTSSVNQGSTAKGGTSSAFDNCSVGMKTERMPNFASHSLNTPYQQSNTSSENNERAANCKYDSSKQPDPISAFKSSESSAFQPVSQGFITSSWMEPDGRSNSLRPNDVQPPPKGSHQHIHIRYHHHHHHYHYHRHLDKSQKHNEQVDNGDVTDNNMGAAALQCGSSNAVLDHADGNTGNNSGSGSASGSNLGSNGNNGSNNVPNVALAKMGSDAGAAEDTGAGAHGEKFSSGVDEERIALREAALSKFRQKRKERCFEKRVRYESRKRLAEQRPRIRGQFVRQIASDSKVGNDCHSNDINSRDNSSDSMQ